MHRHRARRRPRGRARACCLRILVRALVDLVGVGPGRSRRPFHGTHEQVLDDLARLRAHGVTEVFFDLNLSPRLGDPRAALDDAERVLDAFAPSRGSG